MKLIAPLIIAGLLLSSSGCATQAVLRKADPKKFQFSDEKPGVNAVAHPGYFALLPLSVAYDVTLFPVFHIVAVVGVVAFCRIKANRDETTEPSVQQETPGPTPSLGRGKVSRGLREADTAEGKYETV